MAGICWLSETKLRRGFAERRYFLKGNVGLKRWDDSDQITRGLDCSDSFGEVFVRSDVPQECAFSWKDRLSRHIEFVTALNLYSPLPHRCGE